VDDSHQVHRLLNRREDCRAGASLAEVLVAMAIVAVMAALIVPVFMDRLQTAHANAVISEMKNLENGLRMFYRDVGRYPRQLNYLSALEDLNGIRDACSGAISGANQANYRGPYLNRPLQLIDRYGAIPNTRYVLATGDSVEASLTRTTSATVGGGTQQILQILVFGPDKSMTEYIDQKVDGTLDGVAGTVRYTTPLSANDNTLLWTFPIANGAC
jgi:general secretion pathway protein G